MGQMVIRNIDDAVLQALRNRAAAAGRSVEEEARQALALAVGAGREAARARLAAVRATLAGHRDRDAADLVREMRDERTRQLSG